MSLLPGPQASENGSGDFAVFKGVGNYLVSVEAVRLC